MTDFHIDAADRKRIATKWIQVTLLALHLWASMLVFAAIIAKEPSQVISNMFSTVTFGIAGTLAILIIDRAADVILNKFTDAAKTLIPPATTTETVTRTVITEPGTTPITEAKDVNIKAEKVNVSTPSN